MQLVYASTAHDFQGSTVDRVILGMHSKELLATQKAFYVGLSRMREDTLLVTDNEQRLRSTIQDKTGERVNALEALKKSTQPWRERGGQLHSQDQKSDEKTSDETSKRDDQDRSEKATQDRGKSPETERDEKPLEGFDDRLKEIMDDFNQKQLDQKTL